MKFYFLLTFVLFNFTFANCHEPANATTTIEYAKQFRLNPALSKTDEEARELAILEIAISDLHTYSVDKLEEGIKGFLQDQLSENNNDFQIVDVRGTELFGKSEASVFLVKDNTGLVRFVVKAFQEPGSLQGRFMQEISAIDLLQELQLPDVSAIKQYAFAVCNDGQRDWGLLLESGATGKRIDQYIYDIDHEKDNSQRQKILEIAVRAFRCLGASFAHLHANKADTETTVPPALLAKCDVKLNEALSNPFVAKQFAEKISLQDFENYVQKIKEEVLSVPVHLTYVHGDAHLGNSFYDDNTKNCTLIDLAGMHLSVDINGLPLLHAGIDLVRIEDSLRLKSKDILSDDEVEMLHSSFNQGYLESGGEQFDERLYAFYHMYVKLRRLVSKCDYIYEEDPRIRASDMIIFEDAIQFFVEAIL